MNQTEFSKAGSEHFEQNIERYVDLADQRLAEFEQVFSRLVDRIENLAQTVSRIFARGKEQTEHLVELKDKAVSTVQPVVDQVSPALLASRDFSRNVASRAQANPRPFLLGGALVVGGLLLVAYYTRREQAEGRADLSGDSESWRSGNSSDFVQGDVANAS